VTNTQLGRVCLDDAPPDLAKYSALTITIALNILLYSALASLPNSPA
jgi:hypothetical protein